MAIFFGLPLSFSDSNSLVFRIFCGSEISGAIARPRCSFLAPTNSTSYLSSDLPKLPFWALRVPTSVKRERVCHGSPSIQRRSTELLELIVSILFFTHVTVRFLSLGQHVAMTLRCEPNAPNGSNLLDPRRIVQPAARLQLPRRLCNHTLASEGRLPLNTPTGGLLRAISSLLLCLFLPSD